MTQEPLFTLEPAASSAAPIPADPFQAAVPGWLAERLEGLEPARRSAYVRLRPCGKCRAPVLEAADMGLDLCDDSRVDPAVLDPAAELEVILSGRYTADLEVSRWGLPMLFRRDAWLIGGRKRPWRFVVPEHRCRAPAGLVLPWTIIYPSIEPEPRNGETNECPF